MSSEESSRKFLDRPSSLRRPHWLGEHDSPASRRRRRSNAKQPRATVTHDAKPPSLCGSCSALTPRAAGRSRSAGFQVCLSTHQVREWECDVMCAVPVRDCECECECEPPTTPRRVRGHVAARAATATRARRGVAAGLSIGSAGPPESGRRGHEREPRARHLRASVTTAGQRGGRCCVLAWCSCDWER